MLLFSWFAWQGFSRMVIDTAFSWRWYADLIGAISSVVMVAAGSYGIYRYMKGKLRLTSKENS